MSLPRFDVRTVALLTALAAARATKEPARLVAQEGQPHPDIPGTYAAGDRHAAPFPAQLPPLDSVVDSASLAAALKAAGVDKRLVFGLRVGDLTTAPRVHVIEKKVSGQVADRALHEVDTAIRVVPTNRDWAFRLRVEVDPELAMTLERSEVCATVPGPRRALVFATGRATPEGLAQMRREAQGAEARALLQLEADWALALIRRDATVFGRLLADGFIYTEDDRTVGRDDLLRDIVAGPDTVEVAHNEEMRVHRFGSTAVVTGWLVVRGRGASGPFDRRYRFTDTWLRRGGRRQIVAAPDHLVRTP